MRSALVIALAAVSCPLWAQKVGSPTDDLDKIGIEELFDIQVTSVGRKAEQMSKAPAAIFVLTSEDIRRSGATSIPEALRNVPGLTVLQLDGRSWAVSARGSAQLYSNKMLVMIDGRSLYNPLFSGVGWDTVDLPMEDIERIEVVRGPGAVMWGPNAVNGVINIITKKAQATQGGLVTLEGGNEDRAGGTVRGGFSPNEHVAFRLWGKGSYETPAYGSPGYFQLNGGMRYRDPSIQNLDAASTRAGFRMDAQSGKYDSWMVQGDAYKNSRQDPMAIATLAPTVIDRFQGHSNYSGGSLLARWTHSKSESDETSVQFSTDRTKISYPFVAATLHDTMLDVQKRFKAGERHEMYLGGGFQQYQDSNPGGYYATFSPHSSVFRDGYAVARDEWQVVPQRLMASAGMRLDYSSYGHLEYQPSFRLLYTPSQSQSLWAAASRAVRTPSRYDRNIQIDGGTYDMGLGLPVKTGLHGNPDMRSEVERSLEVGYRRQSGQRWSVDASAFWSRYERLRVLQGPMVPSLTFAGGQPMLLANMTETNAGTGQSWGGEVWAYLQVRPTWRLTPEYSYLNEQRWMPQSQTTRFSWDGTLATIGHQVMLRSQHDLTKNLQLDLTARVRSRDTGWNTPGVLLMDARLGWRPFRNSELSVAVENLADRRFVECFSEGPTVAIPMRRTFTVKFTKSF
jgi:iron complex outermembrane receptor protein